MTRPIFQEVSFWLNAGPISVKLEQRGARCGLLDLGVCSAKSTYDIGDYHIERGEPYINIGLRRPKAGERDAFIDNAKRSLALAGMALKAAAKEGEIVEHLMSYTHPPMAAVAKRLGFSAVYPPDWSIPYHETKQVTKFYNMTEAAQKGRPMRGVAIVHMPTNTFIERFAPLAELTPQPSARFTVPNIRATMTS